jgi:copper resistance protein C
MRLARALLLGFAILAVAAGPAAAHAELVSSDPADKAEVQSPFHGPITLTYDEALYPGTKADLLGPDGSTVASAKVDGDKLVFTLDGPLDAGGYLIKWTSVAVDRDVERGELTFTVVEPPPTPPAGPTASLTQSAAPSPSASPSSSPAPGGNGSAAGISGDVLLPLLAAVIAVGAIGALLLRNRRAAGR